LAEVTPPGFLQNAGAVHTAEILRGSYSGLINGVKTAAGLVTRGGVVLGVGGNLAVTQNGAPNMSVNVAAGQVYVPGTEGSKQATYSCVNDATKNITITAADGTNPRIDLIVAKVQDTLYSGAVNSWSLVVVTGTPAGSPAVPTQPANSVALGQILVGAGVTSIVTGNITDRRFYMAAAGGVITCPSTDRPATTTVPAGTIIYESDTTLHRKLVGSSWLLLSPYRVSNTLSGSTGTVTFSNIPTTLKHIQLQYTVRADASANGDLLLRVNGNSGTNYSWQAWNAFTIGTSNSSNTLQTSVLVGGIPTGGGVGIWGAGVINLIGWDAPHADQLMGIAQLGYIFNTTGGSNNTYTVFAYKGTSASGYTSVSLIANAGSFLAGSEFILEGWD